MSFFQKGDFIITPQGNGYTVVSVWKHPITQNFHCMLKDEDGKTIGDPEKDIIEALMEE